MEEWKFLVQKDGDRSWLPLDSPDVEILEGRYRIVARFAQSDTEVQIRICHLAIAEDPPKRRFQKRSSRTNANGLIVVVPYTYFNPGIWEFSCFSPDPLSDLMGDTLHHSVRLQVFATVAEPDEDWYGDDSDDTVSEQSDFTSAPELRSPGVKGEVEQPKIEQPETENSELLTSAVATTPEIAALNVEIAHALGLSMDRLVTMTEQLSHQLIEEVFREFGAVSSATHFEPTSAISEPLLEEMEVEQNLKLQQPTTFSEVDARAVQIILEQESLQASVGKSVTVAGRLALQDSWKAPEIALLIDDNLNQFNEQTDKSVDVDVDVDESIDVDVAIAPSTQWIAQELRLTFRNPQTSDIVISDRQAFSNESLPHSFNFTVELPPNSTTHLLIGEVEVWGATAKGVELVALQTATVTVTVNPDELMAEFQRVRKALDQEPEDSDLSDLAVEFSERLHRSKTKPVLDLSFLDLTSTTLVVDQNLDSLQEKTPIISANPAKSRGSGLPPQLSQPQTNSTDNKRPLDLPTFIVTTRTTASATAVQEPIAPAAIGEKLSNPDESAAGEEQRVEEVEMLATEAIAASELTEKQRDEQVDSEILALIEQVSTDAALVAPPREERPSPIKSAFQALRLQDRFLDRLTMLAADEELLIALKESVAPEIAAVTQAETEEILPQSPTEEWVTHEVVVDDDPMWQEWMRRSLSRAKRGEALELPFVNPLVMSEDEAIPVPMIEILTDEIVAGRPMNVRLKLPNLLPKIYIKLWVNDRQTRSLLDGPRWMVDFFPNGHDELEAVTQLTVPFGTLAIRLEAIAVEVQTQRESQKISLDCEVIPPDFPELPIEDFNF
ncbi:hypothetical protein AB3R30_17270 [Leptolyngbyaceae cyanobacterium UHCC 1019]